MGIHLESPGPEMGDWKSFPKEDGGCVGVDARLGIYPGLSCRPPHQTRGTALSG